MEDSPPHETRYSEDTAEPAPPSRQSPKPKRKGTPWWAQLMLSLVVIVAAGAAWITWFPGAGDILARYGIALPAAPEAAAQQGNPNAGTPNPGGFQRGQGRTQPVVVTEPVTEATINDKLMAIGEGSAASSVTLTSASGGTLTELLVDPGDAVAAGTVIAHLDSQSEAIAFDRATLAAKDAAAALARATELMATNSISNVQLNAAQLAADNAALELRNAELALQRRSIVTPIAGTVGLLLVTPGNLVNAQTMVTTIEDSSEILINFWVPERYASEIAIGMPVTALAVALPGQSFTGTVSAVDNRIDPASRTLQVQARIPNDAGKMRAGMSFQVTMSFPGETFAAVDPLSIQWSADGAYVWKYAEGKVDRAYVQIVERNTGGVLVTGDVSAGDQVVTQGVLQLQPGTEVRLLDEAPSEEGRRRQGQQQGQGQ